MEDSTQVSRSVPRKTQEFEADSIAQETNLCMSQLEMPITHKENISYYPRPQDSESTASRPICAVNQSTA